MLLVSDGKIGKGSKSGLLLTPAISRLPLQLELVLAVFLNGILSTVGCRFGKALRNA